MVRYRDDLPEEIVSALTDRVTLDSDGWRDFSGDEHDAAFVVAGAKGAILSEIRTAVEDAILSGIRIEEFEGTFARIAAGWLGEGANLGYRARLVYQTNLRAAYGRGREQRHYDPEVLRVQPFVQFVHSDANHPRPVHQSLDGQVFPKTEIPFTLPNGYGCGCRYVGLTRGQVERRGLSLSSVRSGDRITVGGTAYDVTPDPGWDRPPLANPKEQREATLRRMAERMDPPVARSIFDWIEAFFISTPEAAP